MDFRQSKLWANYLESIGWQVEKLDKKTYVNIYKLPLYGSLIRIIRPSKNIDFKKIDHLADKYHAFWVKVEPDVDNSNQQLKNNLIKNGFYLDSWEIEGSQNMIVNLSPSTEQLIKNIKPKWQQYIRKAQKAGIKVQRSRDIDSLIDIWQKNAQKRGFLPETSFETKALWDIFHSHKKAAIFLATYNSQPVAGAFVIFWGKNAYLWHLANSYEYPNFKALYLLVFEIILYCQKAHFKQFSLEGVSQFKSGFGVTKRVLIGSFIKYYHPLLIPFWKMLFFIKPNILRTVYRSIRLLRYGKVI